MPADVANSVAADVKSPIAHVSIEAAESLGAPASRVRVALSQPVAHHVRSERNTVVVDFDKPSAKAAPFVLPPTAPIERWDTLIDTADPWSPTRRLRAGDRYSLHGRSMAVLRLNNRKDDLRRAADWGPQGVL